MRLKSVGFLLTVSMLLTGATANGAALLAGASGVLAGSGSLPCLADLSQSRTFDTGGAQGTHLMQVCSLSWSVVLSAQTRVDPDSGIGVMQTVLTGLGSYTLDAYYDTAGPGSFVAGDTQFALSRSADGNTVTMSFNQGLSPGNDSMVLYLVTNAPTYSINTGVGTVWDLQEGSDSFTTLSLTGTPTQSRVPEPNTTLFILSGVGCLVAARLRRKVI